MPDTPADYPGFVLATVLCVLVVAGISYALYDAIFRK